MGGRLDGKTALVTAAGQGIGRAIAEAFVREGATVHATDLDASKVRDLAGAAAHALDVRATPAVVALAKELGAVDILVNAAGFVHQGKLLDCDEATWDVSFDLNVKSMHRMLHAFVPAMLANGGGSIVNIASAVSSLKAAPNRYVYGATKAAVIGLTKAVAIDHIRDGLRANAICPGTIQSPSLDDRITELAATTGKTIEQARALFVERQPMGRLGTVAEIAAVAVYLASDDSAFTTGQTFVVDGGFVL